MQQYSRSNGGADIAVTPARSSPLRSHLIACIGEFGGTFMFLFFAFMLHITATAQSDPTKPPNTITVLTIAFAYAFFYGIWLLINALILQGITGGMLNPAVTLGLIFSGVLSITRAALLIPVQLLAGVTAAAVVRIVLPIGDIGRVYTALTPGTSIAQGLFLEMLLTSLLVIVAIIFVPRTGALSFMAPLGIGIALFVGIFAGLGYTGASLNPVRSFAPCAVTSDFPGYHWIYWAGPFLGALLAGVYSQFARVIRSSKVRPKISQDNLAEGYAREEEGVHYRSRRRDVAMEQSAPMLQPAPTPPLPVRSETRKPVRTNLSSRSSPGYQSRSPAHRPGSVDAAPDKDEMYQGYDSSSPYRRSSDGGHVAWADEREERPRSRRRSSGRHSDMSRYERAREYEDIAGVR
ncbi:hypothetical protein AC579_8462 [Pseudocercospora musae]|uniref:Aquaporin n=1 Tax=Pseudocercospora musae TaxID=113226 RepID=A0A139I2F2_9PEZI|nr:hypothetical protein AC579_8462 [Pseudocercospora musae]